LPTGIEGKHKKPVSIVHFNFTQKLKLEFSQGLVAPGGLVVACSPYDPKFMGLNLAEDNGIFESNKNSQHDFLERGSKAIWSHVKRFYSMLKNPMSMKRDTSGQNSAFPFHLLPVLLLDDSAGTSARELLETNQEFSPPLTSLHHGSSYSYITWGMNNRPIGGLSSYVVSSQQQSRCKIFIPFVTCYMWTK
jgi:hypothetical protein